MKVLLERRTSTGSTDRDDAAPRPVERSERRAVAGLGQQHDQGAAEHQRSRAPERQHRELDQAEAAGGAPRAPRLRASSQERPPAAAWHGRDRRFRCACASIACTAPVADNCRRVARLPMHIPLRPVEALDDLLAAARACHACAAHLPLGPRPIVQAGATARILVVGQAPGTQAHASGIPWSDRSGERLRDWMGIDAATFYDAGRIAIVPMGLCYPGRGASGDRPPRRECAPLWMDRLLAQLPAIELTMLVGRYAQARFLRGTERASVTANTRDWRAHAPRVIPLPHPSPRNIAWFKANPWFEDELLPVLRCRVGALVER
jgi:uracil-DNA glycosylase